MLDQKGLHQGDARPRFIEARLALNGKTVEKTGKFQTGLWRNLER